jgi:hypothetical protein
VFKYEFCKVKACFIIVQDQLILKSAVEQPCLLFDGYNLDPHSDDYFDNIKKMARHLQLMEENYLFKLSFVDISPAERRTILLCKILEDINKNYKKNIGVGEDNVDNFDYSKFFDGIKDPNKDALESFSPYFKGDKKS